MPRRSSRAAPAPATASSDPERRSSTRLSTAKSPSRKRKPDSPSPSRSRSRSRSPSPSPSRSPSRKSARTTATQSKYFGQEESANAADSDSDHAPEPPSADSPDSAGASATSATNRRGGNRGQAKKQRSAEGDGNSEDDAHSDSDNDSGALKDKELWREGVKTGLGPGKQVFIKKPQMRDPGNVPYRDDALHPNTMLFLQDLRENNERQWLKVHDAEYRAAKKDWETFVDSLSEKITEKDSTIPELPAKDLIFRIHRDARFSKNPSPYKAHFAAAWSRTGKKGPYAAYYVHFQPGSCFVGCGLWMPDADKLAVLREEIDQHSDRLKAVLVRPDMRSEIYDGIPDDTDAAVRAFVSQNKESALKVRPKGYNVDNDNIQLLRLRSFTMGRTISDAEIMDANVQDRIAGIIGVMEPFVSAPVSTI
ncbi:hypothetical protein PHISP_05524 [Aspergillus sp. HF37]|nr:hypothetical protein PHISP_05524 [Aspergillus sp. HF37]